MLESATEYHDGEDDDDEECDDSSSTLSSLSDSVDDVSDVEVGDIDSLDASGLAELLSFLPASVTAPRIPPPTEKASYEATCLTLSCLCERPQETCTARVHSGAAYRS